jgi:hypothetical protein
MSDVADVDDWFEDDWIDEEDADALADFLDGVAGIAAAAVLLMHAEAFTRLIERTNADVADAVAFATLSPKQLRRRRWRHWRRLTRRGC